MSTRVPEMEADSETASMLSPGAKPTAGRAVLRRPGAPQCVANTGGILIVDDTPANLQVLAGMLKDRGYKVRPVPSGKLALQAVQSESPELILLDINMPEMNGYEVCECIKADEKLRSIPVIFISALTEEL